MMRVIFLDIDGVLLPFPPPPKNSSSSSSLLFPESTLAAFQRLLQATKTKHPNNDSSHCHVVLSSTWRVREDFIRDIIDAFQDYGIPISQFHDITDPTLHSERQWEIYDWLQKNKKKDKNENNIEAWLALDDEDLMDGESNEQYRDIFQGHVIKTKSSEGLTMKDVDEAIRLWEAQLQQQEQEQQKEGGDDE